MINDYKKRKQSPNLKEITVDFFSHIITLLELLLFLFFKKALLSFFFQRFFSSFIIICKFLII